MSRKPTGKPNGRPIGGKGTADPYRLHREALAFVLQQLFSHQEWFTLKKVAALAERLADPGASISISQDQLSSWLSIDAAQARSLNISNRDKSLAQVLAGTSTAKGWKREDAGWIIGSSELLLMVLAGLDHRHALAAAGILRMNFSWPQSVLERLLSLRGLFGLSVGQPAVYTIPTPASLVFLLSELGAFHAGDGLFSWPGR